MPATDIVILKQKITGKKQAVISRKNINNSSESIYDALVESRHRRNADIRVAYFKCNLRANKPVNDALQLWNSMGLSSEQTSALYDLMIHMMVDNLLTNKRSVMSKEQAEKFTNPETYLLDPAGIISETIPMPITQLGYTKTR